MEYHWIIPSFAPRYPLHSFYLLYKLFLAIITFYLAGYVTGYLTEEARTRSTELTKTLEDYSRLEAFNRNVVQSIQSGLMTCDLEQQITFVNHAAEEILGSNLTSLKGHRVDDLFPELDLRRPQKKHSRIETTFLRPNGDEMILGLTASPLKDHTGQKMGSIVAFRDLTRIREMEESVRHSERLATIGQLAAGIAHEIRNPLASISGATQLLKEEKQLNDSQQRLMDIIITESNRLNRLITDFLLYAQPPVLNEKPVDLSALVDDTLEVFTRSPQWTQGIELRKEIEPNVLMTGDAQQLQQVLWNLFINSLNAMDGKGLLTARTSKNTKKRTVELMVSDTGKGIA
jgi:two-component system sensor histidine kinase PilS (NtrC family)